MSLLSDRNSCFWYCPNLHSAGSKCSLFKRLGREVNIESRFGSVLIWTALVLSAVRVSGWCREVNIESRFRSVLIWTTLALSPNLTGFDDCLVILMAIILPNGPRPNGGFVIECHYNHM